MAYNSFFASVYDVFTDGVDYSARADYICSILKNNGIESGIILDAACGTGSISCRLLEKGYDVVANDISVAMLNIAREKLITFGDRAVLVCQDMCELDLFGTVNAAVCCLDSLNHLIEIEELSDAFKSIGTFIEPGGIFIFDVNTLYKHRDVLSDRTFIYEDEDDVFLSWQNSECDLDDVVQMFIDVFTKNEDGTYDRQTDYIIERAYSVETISELLCRNGFEILNVFGDMKTLPPEENEERIYFVAKKK
ncbi:MAG: class I SAM-dependent methyltransferase [Ruminococcaceae bacterium]|nr:class I SAM-dependent methyltransferase [Oscillospiraceae bacterium]